MSTFLGIGCGPIQTSIFLSGAFRSGVDRLVIAEVDPSLVDAVRAADGRLTLSIAHADTIEQEVIEGVEMLNPTVPEDLDTLTAVAAEADEVATALPSIAFYKHIEGWLKDGFSREPDRRRFVYAAENHNHAAEALAERLGEGLTDTHCINTVIGKMSGVFPSEECERRGIPTLTPDADRGHLVEAFNNILIQRAPGIEDRRIQGLSDKPELLPFEEAKLYGHNAIHFLLGLHAMERGREFMHETAQDTDLQAKAREAFIDESGAALCKKWAGVDELFTTEGYTAYADDLLQRMTNRFLTDQVSRVCRDLERKLGWEDRLIGTLRVALAQDVEPRLLGEAAALGARRLCDSSDGAACQACLFELWGAQPETERTTVWSWIEPTLSTAT